MWKTVRGSHYQPGKGFCKSFGQNVLESVQFECAPCSCTKAMASPICLKQTQVSKQLLSAKQTPAKGDKREAGHAHFIIGCHMGRLWIVSWALGSACPLCCHTPSKKSFLPPTSVFTEFALPRVHVPISIASMQFSSKVALNF